MIWNILDFMHTLFVIIAVVGCSAFFVIIIELLSKQELKEYRKGILTFLLVLTMIIVFLIGYARYRMPEWELEKVCKTEYTTEIAVVKEAEYYSHSGGYFVEFNYKGKTINSYRERIYSKVKYSLGKKVKLTLKLGLNKNGKVLNEEVYDADLIGEE